MSKILLLILLLTNLCFSAISGKVTVGDTATKTFHTLIDGLADSTVSWTLKKSATMTKSDTVPKTQKFSIGNGAKLNLGGYTLTIKNGDKFCDSSFIGSGILIFDTCAVDYFRQKWIGSASITVVVRDCNGDTIRMTNTKTNTITTTKIKSTIDTSDTRYTRLEYFEQDGALYGWDVNAQHELTDKGYDVWDRYDLPITYDRLYYQYGIPDSAHINAILTAIKLKAPLAIIDSLIGDIKVGGTLYAPTADIDSLVGDVKIGGSVGSYYGNNYIRLEYRPGAIPKFPGGTYPVLKSDFNYMYFVNNNIMTGAILYDGGRNSLLNLYDTSGNVQVQLYGGGVGVSYINSSLKVQACTTSALNTGDITSTGIISTTQRIITPLLVIGSTPFAGSPDRVILTNSTPITPTTSAFSIIPGYDSLFIPAGWFNGKRYLHIEVFTTGLNNNMRTFNFVSRNTNSSWETDYNVLTTGSYNCYYYFDIFCQSDTLFCVTSKRDYSGLSGSSIAWNNVYDNDVAGYIRLIYDSGSGVGNVIRRISVYVKNDI